MMWNTTHTLSYGNCSRMVTIVKNVAYSSSWETHLRATRQHLQHGLSVTCHQTSERTLP